jgi:hypothetical protein
MNEEIRQDLINLFEKKIERFKNKQMTNEEEWEFFKYFLREKYEETIQQREMDYFTLGWYIYNFLLPK